MGNTSLSSKDMTSVYGRTTEQNNGILTLTKQPAPAQNTKPRRLAFPFTRYASRSHHINHSNKLNKRVKSPLMRSILARDWQKVLIRARLVPCEVHEYSVLEVPLLVRPFGPNHKCNDWGETTTRGEASRLFRVRVLPIHAACALRPPPEVVQALLSYAVGSAFGRGGIQNHRRARPKRQQHAPLLLYHEHNTSLATVAVGRPDETSLTRAIIDKILSLGEIARRGSRGQTSGGKLAHLCSATEEDDVNDTKLGGDRSEFVGWGSGSRDPPDRIGNEKEVTLFLKKMEDHLAHNGRCLDETRETTPCLESVSTSHCRRPSRSIFVVDFDPSVLLPSPSAVKATEKQLRGPHGHPDVVRDHPTTNEACHSDGLISLENSIGDVDTAMTTSTPRLIGDVGSRRKDGNESSSLEYLTDESPPSDSSASSSILQPPSSDCDDSDVSSGSDSNSFLQLTADGGLALVDLDDSTNSSSYGHTSNDKNSNSSRGDSDPYVSTSTSESFLTNASGTVSTNSRPLKSTLAHSRVKDSLGRYVVEDIQPSFVALLRSLPRASRQKRRPEKTKVVDNKQTGKPGSCHEKYEACRPSRLLPLHIACLYGASASVLKVLLQEYPEGSSIEVLGMLPVHMIAASWSLELIEESARSDDGNDSDTSYSSIYSESTMDRLVALLESSPQHLWAISFAHGLRPLEYIRILLSYPPNVSDEGILRARDYLDSKEKGYDIRSRPPIGTEFGVSRLNEKLNDRNRTGNAIEATFTSTTSGSTIEHDGASCNGLANDSFPMHDSSTYNSANMEKMDLSDLLTRARWEEAMFLLERNPEVAKRRNPTSHHNFSTTVKVFGSYDSRSNLDRPLSSFSLQEGLLPIHLVCQIFESGSSVPLDLVRSIVASHPDGLRQIDGRSSRSFPLHLICDSFGPRSLDRTVVESSGGPGGDHRRFVAERLAVLQLLLRENPPTTRVLDGHGRLPLHRAILAGAPFEAIRMLIYRDPKAIALPDGDGATPFCLARKMYPRDSCVVKLLELAWI